MVKHSCELSCIARFQMTQEVKARLEGRQRTGVADGHRREKPGDRRGGGNQGHLGNECY